MHEEYYTVAEVAKRLKVTRAAVYNWMRSGALAFVYVGQDRRITESALQAFIRPGQAEGGTEADADTSSGDSRLTRLAA